MRRDPKKINNERKRRAAQKARRMAKAAGTTTTTTTKPTTEVESDIEARFVKKQQSQHNQPGLVSFVLSPCSLALWQITNRDRIFVSSFVC